MEFCGIWVLDPECRFQGVRRRAHRGFRVCASGSVIAPGAFRPQRPFWSSCDLPKLMCCMATVLGCLSMALNVFGSL